MSRILIVGGTGMLGYTLLRKLGEATSLEVHATVRDAAPRPGFAVPAGARVHYGTDALFEHRLEALIAELRPTEIINCVGLIKQLDPNGTPAAAVALNSLLPHRLAEAANRVDARLIHFSTDCVFDGRKGRYTENDRPDADDLYGRSKRLGEVDYGRHLTLRTSLIGHELRGGVSLIDWFLAQRGRTNGYRKAVFSGFPTVAIADFLSRHVLPDRDLRGLHHLAANPIDKWALLSRVAEIYGHRIDITPIDQPVIDRSLDGSVLNERTGFAPPDWETLLRQMHGDFLAAYAPHRSAA